MKLSLLSNLKKVCLIFMKKLSLVFLLVLCAFIVSVWANLTINPVTVTNQGNITTVNLEVNPTTLDWGTLYPSQSKSLVIQVRPSQPTPMTLSYVLSNWQPANASTYLTLTWNYTGATITDWTSLQFTLTVSSQVTGITNFSFDITITGTQT